MYEISDSAGTLGRTDHCRSIEKVALDLQAFYESTPCGWVRATPDGAVSGKRGGTETQLRAERLRAISQRVIGILEAQRRELSAELHDRLGQDLASIKINLQIIKDQLSEKSRNGIESRLDESIGLVGRATEFVREVAGTLRPLVLDDAGLAVTLKSYGEQFAVRTGIRVLVEAKHPVTRLRQDAELALFRTSQEALTNVLKHAKAAAVRLILAVNAQSVSLTIADNGSGFDAASRVDRITGGLGLLLMRERLRAVGGSLRIESRPGEGTRVIARVRRGH